MACRQSLNDHIFFVSESGAVKNLRFTAPEAVKVGDDATLTCDFDLEDVALYSIRWYRFEVEFYRYLPKESPPTKVFPLQYIRVDVSIPYAIFQEFH